MCTRGLPDASARTTLSLAGGAAGGSALSASASDRGNQVADAGEKLAAAMASRASAEADVAEVRGVSADENNA